VQGGGGCGSSARSLAHRCVVADGIPLLDLGGAPAQPAAWARRAPPQPQSASQPAAAGRGGACGVGRRQEVAVAYLRSHVACSSACTRTGTPPVPCADSRPSLQAAASGIHRSMAAHIAPHIEATGLLRLGACYVRFVSDAVPNGNPAHRCGAHCGSGGGGRAEMRWTRQHTVRGRGRVRGARAAAAAVRTDPQDLHPRARVAGVRRAARRPSDHAERLHQRASPARQPTSAVRLIRSCTSDGTLPARSGDDPAQA
jgi:hypothetical protein